MTDLADRSTGDIITSADQNLMVDYIQDGTHKINTLSLSLGGTEIITSAFAVTNVISATIVQTSVSGSALSVTRDLASASTDNSVVKITQDNAGDDQPALSIQQDGNADALQINTTATMDGEYGIRIDATSASTTVDAAGGIRIAGGSARGIYCVRDSTSAYTTGAVAAIIQDNASDDQPALSIQQNGAGDSGVKITHNNAAGYGLDITSIGANQYAALRSICTTTSGMAAAIEKNVASSTYPTLRVAQYHATGGQPVVELRQVDISEGFIDFVGTDTGAVATSTTNSNASVTVEVNGTKYKIPLFAV